MEVKLNKLDVYKKISALIINFTCFFKSKDVCLKDKKLLNLIKLQVQNLFILEKNFLVFLNNNVVYAKVFEENLNKFLNSNLDLEKTITEKSLVEIYNEYNVLLNYIFNIYSIDKKELTLLTLLNTNSINNKFFSSSKTFSPDKEGDKKNIKSKNINFESNNSNETLNNQSFKNNQAASFQNLYNFKTHPRYNVNFFPLKWKIKEFPILKVIFATLFLFVVNLYIVLNFYSFYNDLIKNQNAQNQKKGLNIFLLILKIIVVTVAFLYIFNIYKVNWTKLYLKYFFDNKKIIFILISMIFLIFQYYIPNLFESQKISFVNSINNKEWALFSILLLLLITISLLIIFIFFIFIVNPEFDRQKITLANLEYSKYIQNTLLNKEFFFSKELFAKPKEISLLKYLKNKIFHK